MKHEVKNWLNYNLEKIVKLFNAPKHLNNQYATLITSTNDNYKYYLNMYSRKIFFTISELKLKKFNTYFKSIELRDKMTNSLKNWVNSLKL